jgi:FAD/FMN-containing dehydrogenase
LHESLTVRPAARLNNKENRQRVLSFMNEYNKLVHEYGGNLTGDCAEGRLKGIFVNQYIDKDLKAIYKQIREIFDPRNIMNPDVKQGATPKSVVKELRNSYNIGIVDR